MKIGYTCICLVQESCKMRTCPMNYASETKLLKIIVTNLKALQVILSYNAAHHILMFHISSDLIPFGSSEVNTVHGQELFATEFKVLGDYILLHKR